MTMQATAAEKDAFLKMAAAAAKNIAGQPGVHLPASVTMAQAILESGWGKSEAARLRGNYFGIKKWQRGQSYAEMPTPHDPELTSKFRTYSDADESFKEHDDFIMGQPRYALVKKACAATPLDLFEICKEIQLACYSVVVDPKTKKAGANPQYAASLMELIKEHRLTQYDLKEAA
jgi:flagellum-specific peptidoglycan hydrolase FlgJ